MNLGIIGCGLIGRKRALQTGSHQVVGVYDPNQEHAVDLANQVSTAKVYNSGDDLLAQPSIDVVVVATPHDVLTEWTLKALRAGKHVLVEKPGGRTPDELSSILEEAASRPEQVVRVGFNHRFHPAFTKAREIFESGVLGPMMMIRGQYGHGGRVGYEKEWRMDEAVSGGGEAVDQGVHLIDLARWFMGDFSEVSGYAPTLFWDIDVEDNAFMLLKTNEGKPAWLHATWTEWKNCFHFEISGRDGKLQIDGLGGSYGVESLTYHQMLPEMGPPVTNRWEFDQKDESWLRELESFERAIAGGADQGASLDDAYKALEIAQKIRTFS